MNRGLARWFELAVVICGLFLLAPFLLVVSGLIRLLLGSPVLYRQQRTGRGGRLFRLHKFRTMSVAGEGSRPDEDRLTCLGRLLRATSVDELPSLLNVLKGEMALVGPRPLLPEYLPLYSPEQSRRHEVKPGITGWAQVNGRNAINWNKKFELDVWYVDHQTPGLDLKILLMTLVQVFRRSGINQQGRGTVDKFRGSSNEECTFE